MKFSCPNCTSSIRCRDDIAGRKAHCPMCGQKIRVPLLSAPTPIDKMPPGIKVSSDYVDTAMAELDSEVQTTFATSTRPVPKVKESFDFAEVVPQPKAAESDDWNRTLFVAVLCILGFFLILAASAVGLIIAIGNREGKVIAIKEKDVPNKKVATATNRSQQSQMDLDYFRILEISYDREALLAMELVWLDDYKEGFRDFDKLTASLVSQRTRRKNESLEATQTFKRSDFVANHKVESLDWKASFKQRYPEREVIFDEVKVMSRLSARAICLDAQSHILSLQSKMPLDNFKDARFSYLDKNADKWIDELLDKTHQMSAIRSLEKKILAAP